MKLVPPKNGPPSDSDRIVSPRSFFQCGENGPPTKTPSGMMRANFVKKRGFQGNLTVEEAVAAAIGFRNQHHAKETLYIRVAWKRTDGIFDECSGRVMSGGSVVEWMP